MPRSSTPRWLRHSTLIAIEAVLVVGWLKDQANQLVMASQRLPDWAKVLFVMAVTAGILGALLYVIERITRRGVAKTHEIVRTVALPMPYLVVHLCVLIALYFLYARQLGISIRAW